MRRVFTLGESLLDIIFKNNMPVAAKAGGSMLNASVSLGRLNVPVYFISEFGIDQVGDMINDFLTKNGVRTDFTYRYNEGKTALALAFLDENQNASYNFYKLYPQNRLKVEMPSITSDDIVMFGSFFGISPEIRPSLLKILNYAKEKGALIIYDPNFRKPHLHELDKLLPFINENIQFADIIKGSNEDFELIFKAKSPSEAFEALNDKSKFLVYTAGKEGAFLISTKENLHVKAQNIEPLSTVGAGDSFNAGLANGLLENKVFKNNITSLSAAKWEKIISNGVEFASEVCLSYDNYISTDFSNSYKVKNK